MSRLRSPFMLPFSKRQFGLDSPAANRIGAFQVAVNNMTPAKEMLRNFIAPPICKLLCLLNKGDSTKIGKLKAMGRNGTERRTGGSRMLNAHCRSGARSEMAVSKEAMRQRSTDAA